MFRAWAWLGPVAALACAPVLADEPCRAELTAGEIFALANAAAARGDLQMAEAAWQALADDPDLSIRSEARFRHAMMLARLGRQGDAALLFRRILDEQPKAQRVRLELARMLAALGDEAGTRRALREAQAGGLPPDVARLVDRYSAALRARKPLGLNLEVALAPDSNINRATRSDRLGTVLGDFALDADARERSGVGLALSGQAYARLAVSPRISLLARLSGRGDIYRASRFNDVALALTAGPEVSLGSDRLTLEAGVARRWFGGRRYTTTPTVSVNYLHPLDRRSQLRLSAEFGVIDNHFNALQAGNSYALSASYERALSDRGGVGVGLFVNRQALRDPGYASTAGQMTLFGYREVGSATVIATLAYGRLEADRRLSLYPRRRSDALYRASLAASWRRISVAGFSPLVRVTVERNTSSIELYRYRRIRTELGIVRSF